MSRRARPRLVAALFACVLLAAAAADDAPYGPPRPHPWGRFGIGTWVERTIRTEIGAERQEGSLRMEMTAKDDKEITLKVDLTAGDGRQRQEIRKISAATPPLKPEGNEISSVSETIEIAGEKYACGVHEYKRTEGKMEVTMKIWVCPARPGYYLRSENTAVREGKTVKVVRRILKFDEKLKWGERELSCVLREEVQTGDGGESTKTVWECDEIPGGDARMEQVSRGKSGERRAFEVVKDFGKK